MGQPYINSEPYDLIQATLSYQKGSLTNSLCQYFISGYKYLMTAKIIKLIVASVVNKSKS